MAIDLQVNEHSFGGAAVSRPADQLQECDRRKPSTPASVYGPLMMQEAQPLLPVTGNASSGPNRNAEKYQRILDAAVAVFADKGFFNSRISDIADRASVADGTVYLYFKNKEEILMTAINTAFDAFMSHARTEVEKLPSPAQRLRRLAFLHLNALGSNRNLAVVFQMELRQSTRFLSEFSHHHMVEYLRLVRAAIHEGQASGVFRRDLSEKIAANCFFGALDEMVTSWVLSEHEYRLSNVADLVVDIFLNGMQAGGNQAVAPNAVP
jgi:TetR/AcrR family fatty acid metabolism transcriptional regulator